jgi:hypothetical protein
MEVFRLIKQSITNAPPWALSWNKNYSWEARFTLTLDEATCVANATVKVMLDSTVDAAVTDAWAKAIHDAWSDRFKLCHADAGCCADGYTITADVEFVTSLADAHQYVTVDSETLLMCIWSASSALEISRVRHEFGHMLGNMEEYFTINGVDWGLPCSAIGVIPPHGTWPPPPPCTFAGTIMNVPVNDPADRHYELMSSGAASLLGAWCTTKAKGVPC